VGVSDVLRDAGLSGYAQVALLLFLLAFVLVVWRVFRSRRPRDWDRARQLPLEDDRVLMPRGEDEDQDEGRASRGDRTTTQETK